MNKIIEVITEPARVETGSKFVLKIKAIRYLTYKEMKNKNYSYYKNYKYKDIKGGWNYGSYI